MTNNDINSISIIGCGWFGLPLAQYLIKKKYHVKGSTTKREKEEILKQFNIEPYTIQLNPKLFGEDIEEFFNSEVIIINIPPGKDNLYVEKMMSLIEKIHQSPTIKYVIFISSTSVYPEINDEIDENFIINPESVINNQLLNAENLFRGLNKIQCTIIRFAGLIGPNRHPGKFFAHKKNIINGLSPVNLIHLDDCIGIVNAVISERYWNQTINGVCPQHPIKSIFYKTATKHLQLEIPTFLEEKNNYKIITSAIVGKKLNYQFKHENILEAINYC